MFLESATYFRHTIERANVDSRFGLWQLPWTVARTSITKICRSICDSTPSGKLSWSLSSHNRKSGRGLITQRSLANLSIQYQHLVSFSSEQTSEESLVIDIRFAGTSNYFTKQVCNALSCWRAAANEATTFLASRI
jgi:hypothetical protein